MGAIENRTLTPEFLKKLKEGKSQFKDVLSTLKKDLSLDMEMRRGKIEVYYRGAFLFNMKENGEWNFVNDIEKKGQYNFKELIKDGKQIIDTENKVIPELEVSQLIVRENNRSSIAGKTDFFVIDREYQNTDQDQFDIVALNWDNDRYAHQHPEKASIVVVEVKNGTGSAKGDKGIVVHQEDFDKFIKNANINAFKEEMLTMFRQKYELGLISGISKDTGKYIDDLSISDIKYVTLLANYAPRSFKNNLLPELDKVSPDSKFFISSFMGYGLYSSCILNTDQLKKLISL